MIVVDKGNPITPPAAGFPGGGSFRSLGWAEGRFEFTREAVTAKRTIQKGRMEIILDGLRLLDEGKIEKLGPRAAAAYGAVESCGAGGP